MGDHGDFYETSRPDFFGMKSMPKTRGVDARDPRLTQWRPLVLGFARKFERKCNGYLELEDLESLGMVALWQACETFREDGGASFGTYANLLIRHAMYYAGASTHRQRLIPGKFKQSTSVYEDDDHTASARELRASLPSQDILVGSKAEYAALYRALDALDERKRHVIDRAYFWDETIKEVASGLGITRERARQLEAEALYELRRRIPPDVRRRVGTNLAKPTAQFRERFPGSWPEGQRRSA